MSFEGGHAMCMILNHNSIMPSYDLLL